MASCVRSAFHSHNANSTRPRHTRYSFFAMINLPFKIHFDAHYTYAGGFFLWAFTLYLGMAAVGLATEFAITILPQKFVSFFLVPWIIVNVS
jgi:flavin-dependent dehydrogenase